MKPVPLATWATAIACVCCAFERKTEAQAFRSHDPQALQTLDTRLTAYVKLHRAADNELPRLKTTDSPASLANHQRLLAEKIRQKRMQENQGNIFSPDISREIRRLVAIAMQGANATHIDKSLKRSEPVRLNLRVNDSYPETAPLQSMPPTLLQNLPRLPPEVDYRIVDHALVLRDMEANLIVDFISDAIP